MNICYPASTDWSCVLTPQQLTEKRADPVEAPKLERAEMLGWLSLQRLTGFRLSICPIVVRPCAARTGGGAWLTAPVGDLPAYGPYISGGRWYNACGCKSADGCGCLGAAQVVLPHGEVSGPMEVKIDGVAVSPGAYRVDNGNLLVRQDGQSWPLNQDMTLESGDPGTFEVSYYPGVGPDDALNYAAGILAAEWYKACEGTACRLPDGATRVARQGISFDVPRDMFTNGLSGIREVDNIVGIYNPHRLVTPSRVISPETMRGRVRTA